MAVETVAVNFSTDSRSGSSSSGTSNSGRSNCSCSNTSDSGFVVLVIVVVVDLLGLIVTAIYRYRSASC